MILVGWTRSRASEQSSSRAAEQRPGAKPTNRCSPSKHSPLPSNAYSGSETPWSCPARTWYVPVAPPSPTATLDALTRRPAHTTHTPIHALLSPQVSMQNMSLTKAQKKTALKSCALSHGLAAGLMTKQMLDSDFKKPIGIASLALQAGLGLACAIRSVGDDDE